jgi:hypothetical protein
VWEQHERDARQLGTTAGRVADFKRRHDLPRAEPLSPAAGALLLEELETAARVHKGRAIERARALAAITERATPEAAAAVAVVVPRQAALWAALGAYVGSGQADAYLLHRLEALTGKRYASPGTARKRCESLTPAAAPAAAGLDPFRRALFWGVVLRLDQLEGPPPPDPAAFYSWCQLAAYAGHTRDPAQALGDLLAGRMGDREARGLLQLPESGPLAPAAIRDAYRAQAREAHPDAGGERVRFERLTVARDRLLLQGAA